MYEARPLWGGPSALLSLLISVNLVHKRRQRCSDTQCLIDYLGTSSLRLTHTIKHQIQTLRFLFLMVYNPLLSLIMLVIKLSYIWPAGCCVLVTCPQGLISVTCPSGWAVTSSACVPFKAPPVIFLYVLRRCFFPLEDEMATHSSTLVWRISWIEEPGGL